MVFFVSAMTVSYTRNRGTRLPRKCRSVSWPTLKATMKRSSMSMVVSANWLFLPMEKKSLLFSVERSSLPPLKEVRPNELQILHAQERSVSFSPDGKSFLYSGERGNKWKIFQTELARKKNHISMLRPSLRKQRSSTTRMKIICRNIHPMARR